MLAVGGRIANAHLRTPLFGGFSNFCRAFSADTQTQHAPKWNRQLPPPVIYRPSHQDTKGLKGAGALFKEPKEVLFFEHPNPAAPDVTLPEELVTTGPNGVNPDGLNKFAVVAINNKQHKVTAGDRIMVDLLSESAVGTVLTFDQVLVVGSANATAVGRPLIPAATVTAEVQEHPWLKDLIVFKKRRRKGYKRTWKVKTQVTILQILDIQHSL